MEINIKLQATSNHFQADPWIEFDPTRYSNLGHTCPNMSAHYNRIWEKDDQHVPPCPPNTTISVKRMTRMSNHILPLQPYLRKGWPACPTISSYYGRIYEKNDPYVQPYPPITTVSAKRMTRMSDHILPLQPYLRKGWPACPTISSHYSRFCEKDDPHVQPYPPITTVSAKRMTHMSNHILPLQPHLRKGWPACPNISSHYNHICKKDDPHVQPYPPITTVSEKRMTPMSNHVRPL
jgi:hypothetical protein